jgi:formaldehyde-activating enzyme involved in methanogenesis
MEQQEVNSIMSMVDGVVAMVMDEDEVDAVLVVAVVFVAMTESKTQAVMKRFQVTWSTGLTS